VKLITRPTVYCLGSTKLRREEVGRFLHDLGVKWETDSTNDPEVLVETNGRVCYLSFEKPRPGGNAAYVGHLKQVGHGSVVEHPVWNFMVVGVSRSLTHELVRHRAGTAFSQLSQRYVDESTCEVVVPPALRGEVDLARALMHRLYTSESERVGMVVGLMDGLTDKAMDYLENQQKEQGPDYNPDLCQKQLAGLVWVKSMVRSNEDYRFLSNYLVARRRRVNPRANFTAEEQKAQRKEARQAARSVLPNATETKIALTINARALRHVIEQRGSKHAEPEIRLLAYELWKLAVVDAPNLFSDYQWSFEADAAGNSVPADVATPYRKI
jgi:thymidylate synthase (FAD)